jgi:uncharacterized protein YjiS (DUF1127 family)
MLPGAKRRLADEYHAAQERGKLRRSAAIQRSINVLNKNNDLPTAADLGLSRKDIHEARAVRDAEKADPGIVRRTLNAAVSAGRADQGQGSQTPSRRNARWYGKRLRLVRVATWVASERGIQSAPMRATVRSGGSR